MSVDIRFFFRVGGNERCTISADDLDDLDFRKEVLDFVDESGVRNVVYTEAVTRIVIN